MIFFSLGHKLCVNFNLLSGVLFSEERESIAAQESAVRFSNAESRAATLSRSSEKNA